MKALGIDVGGTFTDFVLADTETSAMSVLKVASGAELSLTIDEGVRQLCDRAGIAPAELDLIIHGTTVATNALLEYKGARTGMITTAGFRDVTHIGRHQRPQNYSITQDIPWQARPLVRRRFRMPVRERIAPPDGTELVPLDEAGVREAARRLRSEGVEAVAVCFLFAYLDPTHERRAAELVREEMPGAFVCTSSDVVPQFREFERFTTAAINAFVGPQVEGYIQRFADRIRDLGIVAPIHIMQSNGGTATPAMARRRPVTLLLSGPVGGVMGGIWSAAGQTAQLATIDVGGTSADIGIVTEQGLVEARARDTRIAGYPVMVPTIDIETIGAGGGSIAYLDRAGALHVGPVSAGAMPGPAAYGHGGSEPTLTDANVVLGRLPGRLADGLDLDVAAAEKAVARLAGPLGLSTLEAAAGIVRLLNENMAAALRIKTIQRGFDTREFLLAAFGGAGPLQAAELARILEIPRVLVPPNPGVTSAAGLLTSDLRYDVTLSVLTPIARADHAVLTGRYRSHERMLRDQLREDGCGDDDIDVQWAADLRYHGQSHELKVAVDGGDFTPESVATLQDAFHRDHHAEFGHSFPDLAIEFVNVRLTGIGRRPRLGRPIVAGATIADAFVRETDVGFAKAGGGVERHVTPVYDRDALPVDEDVVGPVVIVQLDSTTLVPPAASVRRDARDNLLITV